MKPESLLDAQKNQTEPEKYDKCPAVTFDKIVNYLHIFLQTEKHKEKNLPLPSVSREILSILHYQQPHLPRPMHR